MKNIRIIHTFLLTTALVAVGSLHTTSVRADSSSVQGQPRLPLGAMGGYQAAGLDTGLDFPESRDAASWRSYDNGSEHHYDRRSYGGYGPKNHDHRHFRYYRPRPSDFETEEFKNSDTAAQSKAQFAYARGADGSSVRVGVIDEQFDLDHPELEPNIVDFIDITAGNRLGQANIDDEDERRRLDDLEARLDAFVPEGHGTLVSGVIAAVRDGKGIHGLAPEAELVPIRVLAFDTEEIDEEDLSEEEISDDDIGTTFILQPVDSKNPNDSQIFNLSEDPDEQAEQIKQIVAAVKDDNTEVLVAFENGDSEVFNTAFIQGLDSANEAGVDIVSISLGSDEAASQAVRDAVVRVTDQERIVVMSNGNDDRVDEDGNPLEEIPDAERFQREIVTDARTNGLALIVSMIDENNEPIVNNCGSAKENCLVARGLDVRTTANGGGIETVSGSSFAAPTVSGGLALLLDLFPTLYPGEAVALVKATADDLGEEGVDDVFGHGALNLERAVKPVGVARLPTGKNIRGKVVFLSRSKLGLSGAFGNAFAKAGAFKNGFFLDEFRRPFKADLSQQVVAQDRGINFEGVLGGSDVETETFVNPDGYQVTLSLRDGGQDAAFETPLAAFGSAQDAYERENQLQSLRLSGELAPGLEVSSGVNLTAGQQLTADPASEATKGLFLFEGDAVNPQHGFLGRGNGLSLTQDLTKGTSLTLGFLTAGEQLGDRGGEGTTTQADLNHRFNNGAALGFSASFTQESEGFLGSEASGAFAARSETTSQFYTLSGSLPVTAGIEAFGSTTLGISDLSGVEGGLLSDLDRATSSAFAMGVVKKGVIDDQDRIGIRFSQPLRIEGGADATLSVPTSVNADGTINETSETVNLQPSGRELNLQLAYTRKLAETVNVTNYALARSEPGHNAEAKPDIGVGVRVNWNF